jgi:DNA-binding CsgD family transcriptional regulator
MSGGQSRVYAAKSETGARAEMVPFLQLARCLHSMQSAAAPGEMWPIFDSFAQSIGVIKFIVFDSTEPEPELIYTNLASPKLDRLIQTARAARFPILRIARRTGEPFLLANTTLVGSRRRLRTQVQKFRAIVGPVDLFIVPVQREESMLGACYFLSPSPVFDTIHSALLTVATSAAIVHCSQLTGRYRVPSGKLSARELSCLASAVNGQTNVQIAAKLGITERTVRFHFDRIRRKLAVASRTAAIRKAKKSGLV